MSTIPYRLRESRFRAFEALIKAGVQAYPEHYKIPSDGNDAALAARLRDALCSYRTYQWPSKLLHPDDAGVISDLTVYLRESGVWLGPSGHKPTTEPAAWIPPKPLGHTDVPDLATLTIYCEDISKGVIDSGFVFRPLFELPPETLSALSSTHHVFITPQSNGSYIIT